MSTAAEQWEAIDDSRRRDAWVHQHVFGRRFWVERRGTGTYVVSDNDGREPWTRRKLEYREPERYTPCNWDQFDWSNDIVMDGMIPAYTTDANADYLVLKNVRDNWKGTQLAEFCTQLTSICWNRTDYVPGAYSKAAYITIQEAA
jgi:hypothetical protein